MTIRNAYENCLIELNKVKAPSLLVDDFVYFFNKAIQQYENERYSLFETKQQLTDDLRVLTKTLKLEISNDDEDFTPSENIFGDSYLVKLPADYVHMLNCVCAFKITKSSSKCEEEEGDVIFLGANKLDTSQWSQIITNYYMKPSVNRPYYYIINVDDPEDNITYQKEDQKESGTRYGNSQLPIMLIKCGNSNNYKLESVYIDYLRAPKFYKLDIDDLDEFEDNTELIEFPDYVVYEIINKIVRLLLENAQDPRLQTSVAVNQSIAL